MRHLYRLLFIFILCISTGCTKNNGDIGGTYGLWRLSSLSIDDKITLQDEDMFIAFQSSVSSLRILNKETNQADECFGVFSLDSQELIKLEFFSGNVNIYKEFGFDSNPFVCHITIVDNMLIMKQRNKQWKFKRHR